MKIVLNTQNDVLLNDFIALSKNDTVEIINAKIEKILFDSIYVGDVDAFVLENSTTYCQKAIDYIKKKQPFIPIIVIALEHLNSDINNKSSIELNNVDIIIPKPEDLTNVEKSYFYKLIVKNVVSYKNNFKILQRLTTKIKEVIQFGNCFYDPNKRMLYHRELEVAKFSEKAGGIIEMLTSNYGKLVKKELILHKVWSTDDYFASRSMDVYVTNIRKVFKENKLNFKIKAISKKGLILE